MNQSGILPVTDNPQEDAFYEKIEDALQIELRNTTFIGGVISMARSCKDGVALVRAGKWTADQFDRWIDSVINNDVNYITDPIIRGKLKETA